MKMVTIDPITRIEGHLKVELEVKDGKIQAAWSSGALYRGLEQILIGRHPLDAQKITQRICGVCPVSHSTASALCLDDALGIAEHVPKNGHILRNLILGANFLHNHILHFYHLSLPDYLDPSLLPKELEPLASFLSSVPTWDCRFSQEENMRLATSYVDALVMRRKAQELVALFGGKMPHDMAIVPGGITCRPDLSTIQSFRFRLQEIRGFIEERFLPDVLLLVRRYQDYFELGRTKNCLSFGGFFDPNMGNLVFPRGVILASEALPLNVGEITESVAHAWYSGDGAGHPKEVFPLPQVGKPDAYSWVKAPRYRGEPCEVGPAARLSVGLVLGDKQLRSAIEEGLRQASAEPGDLRSVAGRLLARAIEARYLATKLAEWLSAIDLGGPVAVSFRIPKEAEGCGMTEAPRGALGHWIRIEDGRIRHYQVVSPTTWNASPRDEAGKPGPIEEALSGTKVEGDGRTLAGRIVRSFDPCLACAVQ